MGRLIDEHIGVIEDLKSTMSVCMPEPEKTEICASLNEAIDTMHKYQKIKNIICKWEDGLFDDEGVLDVEVLEMISNEVNGDGNDD